MPHECTTCGRTFPDGSKEMLSGCPDCGGNKFQFAPAGRASSGSSDAAQSTAEATQSAATDTAQSTADAGGTAGSGAAESPGAVERAAETVRDFVSSDADTEPSADAAGVTGDGSARSWPSSDDRPDPDASTESDSDGFAEWPETARRPEDRSNPPADDLDTSSASTETAPDRSSATADGATTSDDRSIMADSENSAQADARSEVVTADDLPAGADRDAAGASSRTEGPADDAGDRPPEHGRVVSEPSGETPSIEELRAELNEQFESIKIVSPGQYELNLMELYNREEYIISLQEDGRYVIDVPDSWRADED